MSDFIQVTCCRFAAYTLGTTKMLCDNVITAHFIGISICVEIREQQWKIS